MSSFLVLFAWIVLLPIYITTSFYERQHKEFITLSDKQLSSLPHLNEQLSSWPVIKYKDLNDKIRTDSSHFNRLDLKTAESVYHASISIISIYKHVSDENIKRDNRELYPYQIGTCTLIKDPYPNDPRITSLERNFPFNEEYYASQGMHLPEGDVLIKSLNCITNYHIVTPYIRFYSNSNESSICSLPFKSDPECYKLLKVYLTTHPGLFLKVYKSNNNTRKKQLFIDNDYKHIHKYLYISPISVIQYPKIPGKPKNYYLKFDENDFKKYDIAIINFEEMRGDFDMKYMLNYSLPICDRDYPGWIIKMRIFIIGFPSLMMGTDNARLMRDKGVWKDVNFKYISVGDFGKMMDYVGEYELNVNEGNAGGVISHFVIQPGYDLCVNLIHSNGQYGIKVNMSYLDKLGLSGSFRFPVEAQVIENIMKKQAERRGTANKNEL